MHKCKFLIIFVIITLLLSSCNFSDFSDFSPLINEKSENTVSDANDTGGISAQFHFIDVGQGDCIFIQGGGTNILIDSGTAESGSVVYKYLKDMNVNYLDYFIGTHPHEDHLGGASAVLSSIDVGTVFLNFDTSSSYFYERFVDTLIKKDITPVIPDMDCLYETGPFKIKFLSPKKDFEDANDNSLITMIQFGSVKALFMGDAERAVESELLSGNYDISADILKVGHHGSRYASSQEFLNAVYPGVAVIQCGEGNSYGHPHSEALKRLSAIDATILRTDESGSIVLTTDGSTIRQAVTGELFPKSDDKEIIPLIYIGNRKSKIFHTEACPNLPGENNRIEFDSREAAIKSGYKACGNCYP